MLRILRLPEVEAATGLKKTRLYQLEKAGKFPKRVRISDRASGWRSDDIEGFIRSRPHADNAAA
jgi:prophage regulatory protein